MLCHNAITFIVLVCLLQASFSADNNVCPTYRDYVTMRNNSNCWYNYAADLKVVSLGRFGCCQSKIAQLSTNQHWPTLLTSFWLLRNSQKLFEERAIRSWSTRYRPKTGTSCRCLGYPASSRRKGQFSCSTGSRALLEFLSVWVEILLVICPIEPHRRFHGLVQLSLLAFLLADAGYDVWLGNYRGTEYSEGHTHLNVTQRDYWNYGYVRFWQIISFYTSLRPCLLTFDS